MEGQKIAGRRKFLRRPPQVQREEAIPLHTDKTSSKQRATYWSGKPCWGNRIMAGEKGDRELKEFLKGESSNMDPNDQNSSKRKGGVGIRGDCSKKEREKI